MDNPVYKWHAATIVGNSSDWRPRWRPVVTMVAYRRVYDGVFSCQKMFGILKKGRGIGRNRKGEILNLLFFFKFFLFFLFLRFFFCFAYNSFLYLSVMFLLCYCCCLFFFFAFFYQIFMHSWISISQLKQQLTVKQGKNKYF